MKIELTIKTTYLPSWGAYEGVRELLQNAKDAETESGAIMSIRHRKDRSTLVIENVGCILPHEALLLGHTTKNDRGDLIGKFGEGLKLGVLALVRAGHPVKIRSGSEVWIPSIQRSEKFDAEVLVFDISTGRKNENRVQVEVGSIDQGTWDKMKDCFLFLGHIPKDQMVETYYGRLLIGERWVGKLFVKGIYVQQMPNMSYGYDFSNANVDRDRKMVESYDLKFYCHRVLTEAMRTRPDLIQSFTDMLDQQAKDVEGVDTYAVSNMPPEAIQAVVATFTERHGPDAVPVDNLADSVELDHLGKKGVVVPKPLKAVLENSLGNVTTTKAKLREEAIKTYSWHELTDEEKVNFQTAAELVGKVENLCLTEVDIVDFRDPKIGGMFRGGRVLISKSKLSDLVQTLTVLVHEVAHRVGVDGEHSHISRVEDLWGLIVRSLLPSITLSTTSDREAL
jgi:hypothetical protein